MDFERKLPTEQKDIADIVGAILTVQARFAAQQKRPLGRGTHTKGVCARAMFEVFDVSKTVGDSALAARLARGLFAKPGVYPATVRFANAASTFRDDSSPDVRALSFALELPAGAVAPDATRLDFSMNNAPTFPINDAHAFAAFMRVQAASGVFGHLRALWSLSFGDLKGFAQTAWRGIRQQRGPIHPYQQTRYWSNVPFLHGQTDAVKYSAIPGAGNEGRPVGKGKDVLRDELARHLAQDPQPAQFDLALQLLDPAAMTVKGQIRDASFWIENASVEWPEAQAPFTIVGRLTLQPGSLVPEAECQAMFIDVTKHSLPDHRPLGSINRARWVAESASRKARLGAAPASPAPATARHAFIHQLSAITVGTVVKSLFVVAAGFALLIAALSIATILYTDAGGGMLPRENVDRVVYPDQGWGSGLEAAGRQTYYYTPQGAVLKDMRYSWFVNLEMPWGRSRFADPEVLRRYGFLVDNQTDQNPDRLPVGFTKHFDQGLNEELIDITCAACHTGQLNVTRNGRTTALRIDGGSGLHAFTDANFGHFVPTMVSSMVSTASNPLKFNRFARKVLGDRYPEGRWALHGQLRQVIANFARMGWNEKVHGLAPTEEGYGRTDALARIANTVFGDNVDRSNYAVGNAPVNYPPVWNIWKFDWVQYNASVSQPMARNIGESMGTGAKYALINRYGGSLPPDERFRSSALIENLHTIELALRKLKPPAWSEDVLGPIDRAKAARGKALFNQFCVKCHGPFPAPPALKARDSPLKGPDEPEWVVRTVCVGDIGTDPNTADNFARATVDLTRTGLTAADIRRVAQASLELWNQRESVYLNGEIARLKNDPAAAGQVVALQKELAGLDDDMRQTLSQIDPAKVPVGSALSYLGTMIRDKAYADLHYTKAEQDDRDGFGILDLPQVVAAYKPRPLSGVWATPPYLHNGSVPTIYDLLSPAQDRPKTFRVGSREFDPVKVGLAAQTDKYWIFDTSKDGNHNTGHEFRAPRETWKAGTLPKQGVIGPLLSSDERLAIIEHLKVRNDDTDGPTDGWMPPRSDCPPPPNGGKRIR